MGDQLARIQERLMAKLEAVKTINEILNKFPELRVEMFGAAVSADESPNAAKPIVGVPTAMESLTTIFGMADELGPRGRVYRAILAFFRSVNNTPHSIKDIAAKAGVNRQSVGHIIYRSRKDDFEKFPTPYSSTVRYRMKPELLEAKSPVESN